MRKTSFKKEKFEEMIQNEINSILRFELNDARLTFVSVTKVELTADFSEAKIFWDTFDRTQRGDCSKAISAVAKKIRSLLASKLQVRHTPALHFFYDTQFEDESKISAILEEEKERNRYHPESGDDADS
jgi:ribosome-binding factor A